MAGPDLKPGQTRPTPTPGMGDRVFYETLLRERPSSVMAQEWCVLHGVLPVEEAARLHKGMVRRRKGGGGGGGGGAAPASPKRKKAGKARIVDAQVAFDAGMRSGGGGGMGTAAL